MAKPTAYFIVFVLFCSAGTSAWPCEDEHPPVVAQPVERLLLRSAGGRDVLTLALDPRGVGAVAPADDDANQWIDTQDLTGAWHYREWQWWKGHPWGDSCRPRYFADVTFRGSKTTRGAVIDYRIDGFHCQQRFSLPTVENENAPYWDLVTTIRNASGIDVEEYAQFFACYTPLNRGRSFWYWDESGDLVRLAERGVGHLDGYVADRSAYFMDAGAIPHCPRGRGLIVGRWRHPVMVSQGSPAGWRSVILLEAARAAALTQGIQGGAMDYILFPGPDRRTFAKDAEFSVHIRHVMLKSTDLPAPSQLEALWADFERSHAAVRRQTLQ